MTAPIRVLLVDDSSVVRGLIRRTLEAEQDFEVVGSVADGLSAVSWVKDNSADVVVLDIEMPRMDGLTALQEMLKIDPRLQVVMASTLTERNADISMRALRLGAKDYVPKPTSNRGLVGTNDFGTELIAKVRGLGARHPRRVGRTAPERRVVTTARPDRAAAAPSPGEQPKVAVPKRRPRVLAIGSSTGGPAALFDLLGALDPTPKAPLFITQHMPATFTPILARHISERTKWDCREAVDGEQVAPGRAYVAPGDHHLLVERRGNQLVIRLDQGPLENFCRPAVDPMLRSLVTAYDGSVLVTILTGMGHDGLEGSRLVLQKGGEILAQDEASSVVWGMPGAVSKAGLIRVQGTPAELAGEMTRAMARSL